MFTPKHLFRQGNSDSAFRKVPIRFKKSFATATSVSPKQPRFKWTKHILTGATVTGVAILAVAIYETRHPLPQFEWDHSKETIAILGTGWGSTSLLKDIDTENYNVVLISPRAYFLFTPLLPSSTVGTVELRSIMQPIRFITRFKSREVLFIEGSCTDIDPQKKLITVEDSSEIKGEVSKQQIKYDYLVVGVGAENATFNIPGVREFACFLKESWDARKIRSQLLDSLESAAFPGQPEEEIKRLLHMVVVGGGPTGIEYAAGLHDFLEEDVKIWYPEIAGKFRITLVEATPHVLPAFSKDLIAYTEKTFAENKVTILNNTAVKKVNQKDIVVLNKDKELESIPYGLLVWATGNTARPLVADLMKKLGPTAQAQRRGLTVDEHLIVAGSDNSIYALGDASATKWAPTGQVASRQGSYLAEHFRTLYELKKKATNSDSKVLLSQVDPFVYNHRGSLAYVGGDKAIAELPGNIHLSGAATYLFWKSAYLSNLFSLRNRILVGFDWVKCKMFGRDIGRE